MMFSPTSICERFYASYFIPLLINFGWLADGAGLSALRRSMTVNQIKSTW